MLKVIGTRLSAMVPTALFASVFTFLLIHIVPGGPAEALAGLDANQQAITALKEQLGLNRPLYSQYLHWIGGVLHGDLGQSVVAGSPVGTEVAQRLPATAELILSALVLSVLIGIPLGVLAADKANTRIDAMTSGISGLGLALPDFFLAIVLIDVFAVKLRWFPTVGYVAFSSSAGHNLHDLVLPVATLTAGALAIVVRQVRSAVLEQLGGEYVRMATAMGLRRSQILWGLALRNALPTLFSVYALLLAGLLGATVILEQLFVIPGLGSLLISSVSVRDYPVLEGIVLVFVAVVLIANFLADIGAALVDPRRRVA